MANVSVNCGTARTGRGVARTGDACGPGQVTGDLSPPLGEAEAGSSWQPGHQHQLGPGALFKSGHWSTFVPSSRNT